MIFLILLMKVFLKVPIISVNLNHNLHFLQRHFCQFFHISIIQHSFKNLSNIKKKHSDITKPQKFQPFNMFLAKKSATIWKWQNATLLLCLMTMGEGQTLLNLNEKYLQNYFLDFAKCAAAIATNVTASKNIVQTKFITGYCQLFGFLLHSFSNNFSLFQLETKNNVGHTYNTYI